MRPNHPPENPKNPEHRDGGRGGGGGGRVGGTAPSLPTSGDARSNSLISTLQRSDKLAWGMQRSYQLALSVHYHMRYRKGCCILLHMYLASIPEFQDSWAPDGEALGSHDTLSPCRLLACLFACQLLQLISERPVSLDSYEVRRGLLIFAYDIG